MNTHFINARTGAWIKGVEEHVPNLAVGQTVILMSSKDEDYKMCWCWSVSILHKNCISTKGYQCYIETYEEATEAAIKYCLENLI